MPISGVRAEFCVALRAEIEAARRTAATSATPLVDGRKIGCLADAFQYVFGAKSAINVPSDSPGKLIIGGLPPAEAVVVSVEGLDVTLSVSLDLGDRVPQAALRSDLVFVLGCLITRIEQTRRKPNPAGDRLLGEVPASGSPEVIADPLLDDTQDAALASSLGRDTTFIWGPSGTAKTQTVGSIGAQLYRRSRSLLLVSHTNRAVDQAVVEIAERLGGDLGAGGLLRLGIPCDQRLREREDLLLDAVVRKRQAELRQRQAKLRAEKHAKHRRIAESERLIGVAAWAAEGQAELADFLLRLHAIRTRERSAQHLAEEVARRASREAELLALLAEAQPAARSTIEAQRLCAELPRLVDELHAKHEAISVAEAAVIEARGDYEKALELAPLLARERALPPIDEQRRTVEALAVREAKTVHEVDAARETLRKAEQRYATASNANAIQRRVRGLVFQIRFRLLVAQCRPGLLAAEARLNAIRGQLGRARVVLAELQELDCQLAPWRKLGAPATEEAHLKRREVERGVAPATETDLERRRVKVERQLAEAAKTVEHFRKRHGVEPRAVIARVQPELAELRHRREQQHEIGQEADNLRKALDADLDIRLAAITALGLGRSSSPENPGDRFVEVALAQFDARQLAAEIDVAALEAEVADCRRELAPIDEVLARIDEELEATRRTVMAGAMVIATTLTRLYLWNEVQDRRFDTVMLDEASMAPIPALWLAARLADSNVVVVGDPRQLPPIKQSQHPLAEKWLGRDVFDVSRVRPAGHGGTPPPHFVQLNS